MEVDANSSSEEEYEGDRIDNDIVIPASTSLIRLDEVVGKPRLTVSYIITINFKSYAGRVVMGPFNSNFTCIIGANGSGKSNLIDALLFVFGSRSNRIRSSGLSGLIHNSKNFQNLKECSVQIHFVEVQDEDDDTCKEISNTKFVISRTAFKNGTSYYKIDDRKVRFKDIIHKLGDFGVDLAYNRFLILQGEVERISLMKPKAVNNEDPPGMLEYIEDIIGTIKYKEPIEKLNVKVQELQDERSFRMEELKKMTISLNALKEPMEAALDFLRTENRIVRMKHKNYQYEMYELKERSKDMLKRQLELTEILSQYEEKKQTHKKQRKKLEAEIKENMKKCEDVLKKCDNERAVKRKFQQKLKELEKEIPSLQRKQKQLETDKKKSWEELNRSEEMIVSKQKEIQDNEEVLPRLTELISKLENRSENIRNKFLKIIKPLEEEKAAYIKQKTDAKEICLQKTELVNNAKSICDNLQKPFLEESEKLVQLQDRYNAHSQTLEIKTRELENLRSINDVNVEQMTKARQLLPELEKNEINLQNEIRRVRANLEEQENVRNTAKNNNSTFEFIMKLKTDGILPGIIGRLGDLGAIDSKYDIAISVACSKLDSIIVDTVETSKRCIEELKRFNKGRANFIILNKLRDFTKQINSSPESQPAARLFDLIKVRDQSLRPAFYHVLRETLVTADIQQANVIAYGTIRRRVVTLQGQIIEISGTMTGGDNKDMLIKGKMGSSLTLSKHDTENLKQQLKALELTLSEVRHSKFESEKLISSLGPEVTALTVQIQQLSIDIQILLNDKPKLENEIITQKNRLQELKPDPAVLSVQSKKIEDAKKALMEAENVLNSFADKIETVNQEIKTKYDETMKGPQTELDQEIEREKNIMSSNYELSMEITKLQMRVKQLRTVIATKEETMVNVKKKLEDSKSEKNIVLKDFTTSEKKLNLLEEELQKIHTIRKEKEKQCEEDNVEHDTLRMDYITKQKEIKNIKDAIKKVENSLHLLQEKMGKLKLNIIPDIGVAKTKCSDDDDDDDNNDIDERCPLIIYTADQISKVVKADLDEIITKETEYLKKLSPNLSAIDDYIQKKSKFTEAANEYKEICEKRTFYKRWLEKVSEQRINEFKNGFTLITRKVKELYQYLTLGGDADLELKDSLNPFSEGIVLSVRPPNKSWKTVDRLSGGEKTLASLTIVFALHHYKMTPFYFMDEIDAALDDVNSFIVANYIKTQTKMAQFIVISLRTTMFQNVGQIIGIFKFNDCTKTTTLKSEKLNKILRKQQIELNKIDQRRKSEEKELNGHSKRSRVSNEILTSFA